ncbi:MAG: hypothetical protein LLG13_01620 [Bacteroidales bacterium]|nr:hypothetical protein [Bacteroidales bacterium]
MKKSILLTIAIAVFLTGLILKLTGLPLPGMFMILGLIIFIAYVIVSFGKKTQLTFHDIIIISVSVILAAVVFSIIHNKVIVTILVGAAVIALIAYIIHLLMKYQKKK